MYCGCCLQAQAQSQVRGGHLAGRGGLLHEGSEAAQRMQEDAAEAFRRHIYVQGLYAKPLGVGSAAAAALPSPSFPGYLRRRLSRSAGHAARQLAAAQCHACQRIAGQHAQRRPGACRMAAVR